MVTLFYRAIIVIPILHLRNYGPERTRNSPKVSQHVSGCALAGSGPSVQNLHLCEQCCLTLWQGQRGLEETCTLPACPVVVLWAELCSFKSTFGDKAFEEVIKLK